MIWDVHPGSRLDFLPISDPGSRGQYGPGSVTLIISGGSVIVLKTCFHTSCIKPPASKLNQNQNYALWIILLKFDG
jgi:hypothetical protein